MRGIHSRGTTRRGTTRRSAKVFCAWALSALVFAGLALPTAGARPRLKAPGGWTQAQVNTAITNGVA
jgi:hypothetical protein